MGIVNDSTAENSQLEDINKQVILRLNRIICRAEELKSCHTALVVTACNAVNRLEHSSLDSNQLHFLVEASDKLESAISNMMQAIYFLSDTVAQASDKGLL